MEDFTEQERGVIHQQLRPFPRLEAFVLYGTYILPSALFAAYAIWRKDFAAALVAYTTLLIAAVLYLGYSNSHTVVLRAALRKYEDRVRALGSKP